MALHFAPLDARWHQRSSFVSGTTALDSYLQQRASQHQRDGIATTHVLTDSGEPARILGYCTLSAAQLTLSALQEADRQRLLAALQKVEERGAVETADRVPMLARQLWRYWLPTTGLRMAPCSTNARAH